ncbi:prepilin-type N-terminal cleavage/methylation domain-containing protein [Acinetobacter sp. CAAS 2-6]|uniref:prepilin-type N-terminal cleavage/methylation domain-containing protein n=1 Tax=Acinetobacter sp. CAAS 2-6 TaxID=3016358 RepID=UPI002DD68F71|nr:prepilin-type N-terminal cleavage/methylation domain-containing protein [Acinetobacter sp. CAAS 2-6]
MKKFKLSQRGVSLIEILIALLLSVIVILAMLRAFITTGKVTAESSLGARTDSNIMLGFIAADRILQGVGFLLDDTSAGYGTNFKVFDQDGVAVNLNQDGKYLVWKISSLKCQALQSDANGLLFYGHGHGYDCSSGLAKPANTDVKERLIQINSNAISNISNNNNIGEINLKIKQVNCTPFGVKNDLGAVGKYQAVLTANIYAGSSNSSATIISNVTCLYNFK